MFAFLFYLSLCDIRTCEDLDFCAEYIGKQHNWAVNKDKNKFEENTLSLFLSEDENPANLMFNINYIHGVGFRFRANPMPADNFFRYDLSNETFVIIQDVIKNLDEIKYETTENEAILTAGDSKAIISYDPFSIQVEKNGKVIVTINSESTLLFQHHLEVEEPDKWESFTDLIPHGPTAVACDFKFEAENVHFSGLGERSAPINIESQSEPIRLFNTDGYEYEPDNYKNLYGSLPFLLAHTTGYNSAVFWMNPTDTFVKFDENKASFISEGGFLDFVVFSGSFYNVIDSYTQLTGRPQLPPIFALGYHQSKWGYRNTNEVRMILQGMIDAGIPFDTFTLDLDHLDNKTPFTVGMQFDPLEDVIEMLQKQNRILIRVCDPHFPAKTENRQYKETRSKKLLVQTSKGMTFIGDAWPGPSSFPDFLNPAARDYWSKQYMYGMEPSGENVFYWNDMNEPSIFKGFEATFPKDCIHYGGVENREVHNLYGLLNSAATFDGLLRRNPGQNYRPFLLSRSFFSGSQRYACVWTGDNTASWGHMRTSIHMTITSGICGLSMTGADVGGFLRSPDELLLARWMQLGSLCYPFFRQHCHHKSQHREPYIFEGETLKAMRDAIINRYKLLPALYTLVYESHVTGSPVTRPMFAEFDTDDAHEATDDFMIGDSILVRPIIDEDDEEESEATKDHLDVYGTKWMPFPGYGMKGDEKVKSDDLSKYPVYIRSGKIVPLFATVINHSRDTLKNSDIEVVVCPDENGSATGRLYLDDGETYSCKEEFLYVEIHYKDGKLSYKSLSNVQNIIPQFIASKKIVKATILTPGKEAQTIDLSIAF